MSIGKVARVCAGLAVGLSLSSVALAEPSSYATPYSSYSNLCPDSHGVSGSGYRDMLTRLPAQMYRPAAPERGVALAGGGGYRDAIARFPVEATSRGMPTRIGVVAGLGYRDSLARFPGTVGGESPRHAVARCGTINADAI
jgi:hypothetical protein